MFDITENKSYDIAAYGFGKKIEQHGFEILSVSYTHLRAHET